MGKRKERDDPHVAMLKRYAGETISASNLEHEVIKLLSRHPNDKIQGTVSFKINIAKAGHVEILRSPQGDLVSWRKAISGRDYSDFYQVSRAARHAIEPDILEARAKVLGQPCHHCNVELDHVWHLDHFNKGGGDAEFAKILKSWLFLRGETALPKTKPCDTSLLFHRQFSDDADRENFRSFHLARFEYVASCASCNLRKH